MALWQPGVIAVEEFPFVPALERIISAPFRDVAEIAMAVDDRTRARLAIFCFSRAHLREKGIAIAAACRLSDLIAESSPQIAENVVAHAGKSTSANRDYRVVSIATA